MAYLSDIEIVQSTKMEPITTIAQRAGIDSDYLEQYGSWKAKVDPKILEDSKRSDGKLILVTAITPTKAGIYVFTVVASAEGKVSDEITLTLYVANNTNAAAAKSKNTAYIPQSKKKAEEI